LKDHIEKLIQEPATKFVVIDVSLCGNPRQLSLIRRIVQASIAPLQVPLAYLNDIKLAVTEACTNVIKHAFKYDQTKKFDVVIKASQKLLYITITYEDIGFNPNSIPLPDFTKVQEGGFGVFIIRKVMDDVLYSVDPANGHVVLHMAKLLEPLPIDGGIT
jgi:serine/threonine-protein kinase RsbW